MTYQSVNPFDGKVSKTFPELTDKQLDAAIATSAACYETWRRKTFAERAAVVEKAAAIMHTRADEFARHATLEMGKRISEARGEVEFSSNILTYYAKNAERFLANVELHPSLGERWDSERQRNQVRARREGRQVPRSRVWHGRRDRTRPLRLGNNRCLAADGTRVDPDMNSDARAEYIARDRILQLLSDGEVASVSTAETAPRLSAGDDYIDLV